MKRDEKWKMQGARSKPKGPKLSTSHILPLHIPDEKWSGGQASKLAGRFLPALQFSGLNFFLTSSLYTSSPIFLLKMDFPTGRGGCFNCKSFPPVSLL
jgi:hypothetical protein